MVDSRFSPLPALILRSVALAMILYQIRLLAGDLADTYFFAVSLITAFLFSYTLFLMKLRPVQALIILAAVPWVSRFLIAFPRVFFYNNLDVAIIFDTLLIDLDRNNFIALVPSYWAAFSTYLSARYRSFLRFDIIAANSLLIIIFSIASTSSITIYRLPLLMIFVLAFILFLQILALILSAPPECKVQKRESLAGALAVFTLIFVGGGIFLNPIQTKSVNRGGGLLTPKLFNFDISPFMNLESEITMSDELVFIVRKDPADMNVLLRRYVLSAYNPKQGFFRHEELDEKSHPQKLPSPAPVPTVLEISVKSEEKQYGIVEQEYFMVNLDASVFIAMNQPVEVIQFENWDNSSFNSAYAVKSYVNNARFHNKIDLPVLSPLNAKHFGFSNELYAFYTDYGNDQRIYNLARKITDSIYNYQDKVEAVYTYLKNGNYRYSLRPGIAPDSNQLTYFLFQSKKGYCSYFAFSMALLLRSLGIPARVAAGFFIDPDTNTFNYYPVRSNMAHAWVEVYFPDYGWVEYDPTTELLADGEDFTFSVGSDQALFEKLMKEIFANNGNLMPRLAANTTSRDVLLSQSAEEINLYLLIVIFLCAVFVFIRTRFLMATVLTKSPRKKAHYLWRHIKQNINLAGYSKKVCEAEAEWAKRLDESFEGIYALYQEISHSRYAPQYSITQFNDFYKLYKNFSKQYMKKTTLGRLILSWIIPPLAFVLSPSKIMNIKAGNIMLPVLILFFTFTFTAEAEIPAADADSLYNKALEAHRSERWERAIELYTSGSDLYAEDARFPWALGNLYYQRRLYTLALEEYSKAERAFPNNIEILYQLAQASARLNQNIDSVRYMERILLLEPNNRETIVNLGWMYFKLHRLSDGRELILSALERFGPDAEFSITLGTIFYDMFQYEDAKKWYLDAVERSQALGDASFTAVTYYNLSILESRFYNYDLAFKWANNAIMSQNRSTGRLARGALFMRRLDFKKAFYDYHIAYELDSSPLSKIDLAKAYQLTGNLELARLYAEESLKAKDLSWMLYYGIDPVRYKRDIHEILFTVYAGLEQTEKRIPYGTWREAMHGDFRRISYWFQSQVHKHLFRKYSSLSADILREDSLSDTESNLDALIQYYRAFEGYPGRALTYLSRAEAIETPIIPKSVSFYHFEEGRMRRDSHLLLQALNNFDPVWQRDMIAKTYTELAKMSNRDKAYAETAAEQLFKLNRGALRQNGIALPAELTVEILGGKTDSRTARVVQRAVERAGVHTIKNRDARFSMKISIEKLENRYLGNCELYDASKMILSSSIPINSLSVTDINDFARTLGDFLFIND